MTRSNDEMNSSASIVRVVSSALVQEPAAWNAIISHGENTAKSIGEDTVGYLALGVIRSELNQLPSPPTREAIKEIAEKLVSSSEPPRLSKLMSPEALAGQALMQSLRR